MFIWMAFSGVLISCASPEEIVPRYISRSWCLARSRASSCSICLRLFLRAN